MKKKFLRNLNLLLGAASVALAGCHTQKKAVEPTPVSETDKPVVEQPANPDEVVCLYGVPEEVYKRPMRKYGPPDAAE